MISLLIYFDMYKKGKWYKLRNGEKYLNVVQCAEDGKDTSEFRGESGYINLVNTSGRKPYYSLGKSKPSLSNIYEYEELSLFEVQRIFLANNLQQHLDRLKDCQNESGSDLFIQLL